MVFEQMFLLGLRLYNFYFELLQRFIHYTDFLIWTQVVDTTEPIQLCFIDLVTWILFHLLNISVCELLEFGASAF